MSENNFLIEPDGVKIAQKYGVPYPDHGLARSPEEAAALAERLGFPVVLKIVSPEIVHKSDLGGVMVGLVDAEEVRRGYEELTAACGRAVSKSALVGVLVSRQVQEGLEVIVGAIEDSVFGPTVMFGLGGIFTEVFKDVAFRIAPLERLDAEEMIREIKGYPLLAGARGQGPRDIKALSDLLLSVSDLIQTERQIKELDLNPVRLFDQGLMALDVRMMRRS